MSIAPPSDIVLDVAQAADPLKLQAATAKLARMAAGAGAGSADFSATLDAAAPSASLGSGLGIGSTLWPSTSAGSSKTGSVYQKFEAVLLQNLVQNILPKDEDLYGDAASSDIVRTMMAEQLSTQLAKSGRVGIARMIEKSHPGMKQAQPSADLAPVPIATQSTAPAPIATQSTAPAPIAAQSIALAPIAPRPIAPQVRLGLPPRILGAALALPSFNTND